MQGQIATGCMHAPRAVCVVVTERRGGGCALPSELVLILLNDYLLQPERERERRPVWGICRQMSHPHPQQCIASMFGSSYSEAQTRSLSFNRLQVYYIAHLYPDEASSFKFIPHHSAYPKWNICRSLQEEQRPFLMRKK